MSTSTRHFESTLPVERRTLLCGLAGLFALRPRAQAAEALRPERAGALSWERFTAEAPRLLTELAGDTTPAGHDAYLFLLASLAARVERVPGGTLTPFGGLEPEVSFGMLRPGTPFFVVEWRLEPHAELPAHCHPGGSVCTLALEGEAEVRHYELEPGAPRHDARSDELFRLRETRRQRLTPGRMSTLSPTRDNLHFFRAGASGARGIDLSTMHGGDGSFSFVDFAPDEPVEGALYEGLWVGQDPPRAK